MFFLRSDEQKRYSRSTVLLKAARIYEIIEKGFAFEEAVKKAQQNADELKALEESFKVKK